MSKYSTLQKPPKKFHSENLSKTLNFKSSLGNFSQSMMDLRPHVQPNRPAPPPPKRFSSKLTANQCSVPSKKPCQKFLSVQKRLEARLTGCSNTLSDDEDLDDENYTEFEIPCSKPYLSKLGSKKPAYQSTISLKTPTYLINGPARHAPPPPKVHKKAVYRRKPLPKQDGPPPPLPTKDSPPPPPPSTLTIPTKRPPPPIPSASSISNDNLNDSDELYEDLSLKEASNHKVMSGIVPSHLSNSVPSHHHMHVQPQPPPLPPHPPIPVYSPDNQMEGDIYEIPGSALATQVGTVEDDYMSMDCINNSYPRPTVMSLQPVPQQLYAQVKPSAERAPPPLPKRSLKDGLPLPPTPTKNFDSDYSQSDNMELYESLPR